MARFVKEVGRNYNQFIPEAGPGSGTVTSVALTAPTGFTVTGSPITSSGTLAIAFATGYGIPPLMTGNSGKFLTTNGTTMSWVNIAGTDVTGAALTEVDDTNVTMTLGGTPSTALLRSVSMTLGWAGQLAVSRGGTGAATLTGVIIGNGTSAMTAITGGPNQILRVNGTATGYEFYTATFLTNPMTLNYDMIYQSGGVPARLPSNITTTKQFLTSIGNGTATTSLSWASFTNADVPGDALTRVNDTNVTLTIGGTPATAVLRATSLTLGWSGTLAVSRGGTGASTLTGVLIGNGTSAVTAVVGTAGQFLRRNTANTAYEFRTLQGGDIAGSELTFSNDTNVTMSLSGTPASALLQPVTIGLGWTGTLAVARGGIGVGTITGVMIGNGTSSVTGITGTANQILRRNAGNTAYEFWTANYMTNPMTLEGSIIYATTGGTPAELFANSTGTRKYLSQINGTAPTWEALSFPTGSGTTNYVAKWTNSTTLGNSQIFDNGSNVGIGDPAPTVLIDAYKSTFGIIRVRADDGGAFYVSNSLKTATIAAFGDAGGIIGSAVNTIAMMFAGNVPLVSYVNGAERARITTTGDFGIGTNSPAYKLDVNGFIGLSGVGFAGNSGNDNVIYDGSSGGSIYLGGTTNLRNAYNNTSHNFQSRGGSTLFTTISSTGVTINSGHLQLPSANYITFGGAYGTDIPTISGTSGGGSNGFLQFYPAGSSSGVKMALRRTGQLYLGSYTTSTSFSGTAVATLAVTNGGDVITIAPSQTTASGTYTPTWTGLANVGSVTAFSCQYLRVGDTVTVSGWVTIDAVADNTPTSLSFSLPINSNTTSVNYLNGTGVQQGGGAAASLSGYGANYGEFEVSPLVDTAVNYSFHFTYRII